MSKNIIFIFEFISGGGFSQDNIPNSLFCEGFAMLRSIIADFKALDFEILTMLDNRVFFLSQFLQADLIQKVGKIDNFLNIFKNLVKKSNFVFIIAPETSHILYNLTKMAKKYKKLILSTNLNAIKFGASKIKTYKFFKKSKIATPKTFIIPYKRNYLDRNFIIKKFREFKRPIVIKPEDGVGAESIHYFEKESQLSNFLKNFKLIKGKKRNYILQEFIEGRDLSVSLIGAFNLDNNPLILSVNFQDINIKNQGSEYLGGYTPLENYFEKLNALSIIMKRLKLLRIEGYYGVDFVENHQKFFHFIEINPRLTTSYIGLKNVLNCNCAELILDSKLNSLKDPEIVILNHSYFTRIDFSYDKIEELDVCHKELIPKLIKEIPEFVTPPISLNQSNQFSSFIATKTKDLISSKRRLIEIIQSLKSLNFNVIRPIQIELS